MIASNVNGYLDLEVTTGAQLAPGAIICITCILGVIGIIKAKKRTNIKVQHRRGSI